MKRLLLVCIVASLVLVQGTSAQISEKQFEDAMKKYIASANGKKELGGAVEAYFRDRQQEEVKKQQEQEVAELENQFKNPVKIDIGSSPVKGPANAKVTIIEFSDFQCPFCKRGNETLKQVAAAYPNDVKVVFKHKPLPMHPEAEPAARATWAAGKQGKFWEMHDALFKDQDKLGTAFYEAQAKTLGLNVDQFKKDFASPEAQKAVKDDATLADSLGVQGTPNFFVNGVAVRGAYPVDHFKKIVDRWLGKK